MELTTQAPSALPETNPRLRWRQHLHYEAAQPTFPFVAPPLIRSSPEASWESFSLHGPRRWGLDLPAGGMAWPRDHPGVSAMCFRSGHVECAFQAFLVHASECTRTNVTNVVWKTYHFSSRSPTGQCHSPWKPGASSYVGAKEKPFPQMCFLLATLVFFPSPFLVVPSAAEDESRASFAPSYIFTCSYLRTVAREALCLLVRLTRVI